MKPPCRSSGRVPPTPSSRPCATRSWAARTCPGTAVLDEEVQARLGVPRDHARAALARLEREGLLVHSLHRGLEVVRISVDDVRDLYATRRTLELAGLEAMVRRRPADDVWLQAAVTA